jgi:Tfp pilus assembly protein PilF
MSGWRGAAVAIAVAFSCLGWFCAAAAPFVPDDDAQVLETGLPNTDPRVRQMHDLAAQLAAAPTSLPLAMRLAERQLAMGVAEADPRFVGYARGTLAAWWRDDTAAPPLRILRGRIMQAQHEFVPASSDLRAALAEAPQSAEALLVLAGIDEATGDLDEAKDLCARFAQTHPGLTAVACVASVGALTGKRKASAEMLADAVQHVVTLDRSQLLWALTILGETAIQGDDMAAGQYLKEALALDHGNVYALTVYADYLLDHGAAPEVLRLLSGFARIDALYLRFALAAQVTGDPQFPTYRADLAARFAAARLQGDTVHLRDAARFALDIEHDPASALGFALQNWQTGHKAPADLRLLLAAAAACHDAAAAKPTLDWMAATHLEDAAAERLARQLVSGG